MTNLPPKLAKRVEEASNKAFKEGYQVGRDITRLLCKKRAEKLISALAWYVNERHVKMNWIPKQVRDEINEYCSGKVAMKAIAQYRKEVSE